jgi:hypothetical protein
MDEKPLRRYAEAACVLLPLMMPEAEASALRARIEEVLDRPPGLLSFLALVEVLRSDPVLSELIDLQQPPDQYRSPTHHLDVETHSRVPPEHEFSVQVSITGTPRGRSARLRGALFPPTAPSSSACTRPPST